MRNDRLLLICGLFMFAGGVFLGNIQQRVLVQVSNVEESQRDDNAAKHRHAPH